MICSCFSQSTTQATIKYEKYKQEGSNWNFNNYYTHNFEDWSLDNISFFKFSQTDIFENNYYKNYVRNRISISKLTDSYFISAFGSGEYYNEENFAQHLSGLNDKHKLKNGISGGVDFGYNNEYISSVSKFKYRGRNFTADEEVENENNNEIFDADLRLKSRLIANVSKELKPFIDIEHYNDLNSNQYYNQTIGTVGVEQSKRFNVKYNLNHSFAIGYDDFQKTLPYFSHYKGRATAKFSQDWMFYGKISLKSWLDKDFKKFYYGNSFIEGVAQQNLSFSRDNIVNRWQFGAKYELYENELMLKSNIQYKINRIILFAEYKKYIGSYNLKRQRIYADLSTMFFQNKMKLSYGIDLEKYKRIGNEVSHRLALDMNI